jgi:hypothetical protein
VVEWSGRRFDQRFWGQGGLQSGHEGGWSGNEADTTGETGRTEQ